MTCTICCFPKPVCLQISCHEFLSIKQKFVAHTWSQIVVHIHVANDETKGKWSYLIVVRKLTIVTLVTQTSLLVFGQVDLLINAIFIYRRFFLLASILVLLYC